MGRIDTRSVSTEMVEFEPVWNRPHEKLVDGSMSPSHSSVERTVGVARLAYVTEPKPALPELDLLNNGVRQRDHDVPTNRDGASTSGRCRADGRASGGCRRGGTSPGRSRRP